MCAVCVCVCVRERETEIERETETERDKLESETDGCMNRDSQGLAELRRLSCVGWPWVVILLTHPSICLRSRLIFN